MAPRLLAAGLLLALGTAGASAQEKAGDLGAGVYIGVPFGVTGKYWIDPRVAAAAALGVQGDDLDFHADVLGHLHGILPEPARGRLPLYLGLGFKAKDQKDALFGLRFVGGASYILPEHPLEIFAELAPVLRFAPSLGSNLDGGVGLRYYFSGK